VVRKNPGRAKSGLLVVSIAFMRNRSADSGLLGPSVRPLIDLTCRYHSCGKVLKIRVAPRGYFGQRQCRKGKICGTILVHKRRIPLS
jgi:hypothetical protein